MPLYPLLVKSLPEKISQCNARGIAANQLGVMPENPANMIISRSFLVNLQYETQASIY